MSTDELNAIQTCLRNGQKIDAIRLCREFSGMGLAEAKAFVESLEDQSTLAAPPVKGAVPHADPVVQALFDGDRISAIRLHRERAGRAMGLREARAEVMALEQRLRAEHGEKFTNKSGGSGCTVSFTKAALLCAVLWWIVRAVG